MIDILTPEAVAQLRAFLVDVAAEGAARAMSTLVNPPPTTLPAATTGPIRVPPDVLTTPVAPTTDAAPPVITPPATPAPASGTGAVPTQSTNVADIPVALVPSDHKYFVRALWSEVYAKNLSRSEADKAVSEFTLSFPQ